MKYTERLKLALVADVIFITVTGAVFVCSEMDLFDNFGIMLAAIAVSGMVCVVAAFNKDGGECRKWRNIWKDPVWQTAGYVLLAVGLIISIVALPELNSGSAVLFLLIMANALIRDIRYYRNAVRFGMDDLSDVNELEEKYPEARPMINRKQKTGDGKMR
ncbi:MAG: hypothetical protein IKG25_03965 [Mogibacterium sp.]|nr:hypothetical protein [Mogibacterium sp.]